MSIELRGGSARLALLLRFLVEAQNQNGVLTLQDGGPASTG